jgi:hypothetical protein
MLRLLEAARRAENTLRVLGLMIPGIPQIDGAIDELRRAIEEAEPLHDEALSRAEAAETEVDKRNATLFDIAELVSGKRDADPFFAVLDVFQRAERFESELRKVKEIVDPGHVAEALDAVDAVSTMMRCFEKQRARAEAAEADAAEWRLLYQNALACELRQQARVEAAETEVERLREWIIAACNYDHSLMPPAGIKIAHRVCR